MTNTCVIKALITLKKPSRHLVQKSHSESKFVISQNILGSKHKQLHITKISKG